MNSIKDTYYINKELIQIQVGMFFSVLQILLDNITDIRCGGAPQLVGLIRKPLTYGISFGIISEGKRYFLGMEIPNESCFANIEWRNKFFEICDGITKKIKEGAAHQPNPMLKKSATP